MGYSEKLLLLSRNISFLDRSLGSKVDFGSNRATPIDEALNANPIQGFVNNISESQSKVSMENVPRHLVHEKQRDSTFEGRVDGPNLLDRSDEQQDQAMDLQVIADRLQRLKNPAINPLMATSTPDRWSEMVEEEPRTFHNIPDSLEIARNRGTGKTYGEHLLSDPSIILVDGNDERVGVSVEGKGDCDTVDGLSTSGPENNSEYGHDESQPLRGGRGGERAQGNKSWADVAVPSSRSDVAHRLC